MTEYRDTTIILPTLNEERNISKVLSGIVSAYGGCRIIVVDDGSGDLTKETVLKAGCERLAFLDRANEPVHGLTISVLEATDRVETEYFVVMDADGQHPFAKVEEVVTMLRQGRGLVIANRAGVEDEWPLGRRILSHIGTIMGRVSLLVRGRNCLGCDILSGFFGCRTRIWRGIAGGSEVRRRFRPGGYKVLFDFLKCAPRNLDVGRVYYKFETRQAESSKIDYRVYMEYLKSCFMR